MNILSNAPPAASPPLLRLARRFSVLAAGMSLLSAAAAPAAPLLQLVSPFSKTYVWGVGPGADFTQGEGPIADVTAPVYAVDLLFAPFAPVNSSTSGCEAADFAGFAAGSIALIQRGTCGFNLKVQNAVNAGAIGALIFNEGQPGRTDPIEASVGAGESPASIPWFFTSYAVGIELADLLNNGPTSRIVRMRTEEIDTTFGDPGGVPEPATWAFMIVGFGGIGATMRLARRKSFKTAEITPNP